MRKNVSLRGGNKISETEPLLLINNKRKNKEGNKKLLRT